MSSLIVPLRSRRQQRVLLAQKLQHLFPAAVLRVAGLRQVTAKPAGCWAVLRTRGGRTRGLDLADHQEEPAVRGALGEARRRFLVVVPVE
jgi:hypothetical protein